MSLLDLILPNREQPTASGLAEYERREGEPFTTRDYGHWHNGRWEKSSLF